MCKCTVLFRRPSVNMWYFSKCGYSCMWQKTCHCGLCASRFTCVFVDVRVSKFGWAVDKRVELRARAGRPFLDVILLSFFKQFSCWSDRILWTGLFKSGPDKAPGYGGKWSLWFVTFTLFSPFLIQIPVQDVLYLLTVIRLSPACENMIFAAVMNILSLLSPCVFR